MMYCEVCKMEGDIVNLTVEDLSSQHPVDIIIIQCGCGTKISRSDDKMLPVILEMPKL